MELNSLSSKITIREGSWEVVHEKYDLILANLVPSAILRTGGQIPYRLIDNGKVVLSGFGKNRCKEVEIFFKKLGFITTDRSALEGWSALLMEKMQ